MKLYVRCLSGSVPQPLPDGDPLFAALLPALQGPYGAIFAAMDADAAGVVADAAHEAVELSVVLERVQKKLQQARRADAGLSAGHAHAAPCLCPSPELALNILYCIASMCCVYEARGEEGAAADGAPMREAVKAQLQRPGGALEVLVDCYSLVCSWLEAWSPDAPALTAAPVQESCWHPGRPCGQSRLLFSLKWLALPHVLHLFLPRALRALSRIYRGQDGLALESEAHALQAKVLEAVQAMLAQTELALQCSSAAEGTAAAVGVWSGEITGVWAPTASKLLRASLGPGNGAGAAPRADVAAASLGLLDALVRSRALRAHLPVALGCEALASVDIANVRFRSSGVSSNCSYADARSAGHTAQVWRVLVGTKSVASLHAELKKPGNPPYAALAGLLGPPLSAGELEYLRCCEVTCGVLVGHTPDKRVSFREQLLQCGSRVHHQLALLLRALQPWLVAKEGVSLRRWSDRSGPIVSRILVRLLEAAELDAPCVLRTALGSSSWLRGGGKVDLGCALDDLLAGVAGQMWKSPSKGGEAASGAASPLSLAHTTERTLCGALCACALARPLWALLAVPRRRQAGATDTEGSAEDAAAVVAARGLFSQHAAAPHSDAHIPAYRCEEGSEGYYASALLFVQRGMRAVASLGDMGCTALVLGGSAALAGLMHSDGSDPAASGGSDHSQAFTFESCSTHPGTENAQRASLLSRRFLALQALVFSWQVLLNAMGRALMVPHRGPQLSQTPASAFSQAPSQFASQVPLTNDEGSSDHSGGQHRVYPREDDKLVAAVSAVSAALVNGWKDCWALLLLPSSVAASSGSDNSLPAVAWAAERFLEAYWWLLHRLSAFRVQPRFGDIGDARQVAVCMAQCGLGHLPSQFPVPLPLNEAGEVSRCALWLGLLPSAALAVTLGEGEAHVLLYAVSRCQKAILEASPPVLEEMLVWLPAALQGCSPSSVDHIGGICIDGSRRDPSRSLGVTVVVQSQVPDHRAFVMFLGTLWQTALVSLTHGLTWANECLDVKVVQHLRNMVLAPLQLAATGQQGVSAWLDGGYAYGADSLGLPVDAWRRLCASWLPHEERLSRVRAAAGYTYPFEETKLSVSADSSSSVVWCGGVYGLAGTRNTSATCSCVLTSEEASVRWYVLDALAVELSKMQQTQHTSEAFVSKWGGFLCMHLAVLVRSWSCGARAMCSGRIATDAQTLEATTLPTIAPLLATLRSRRWTKLLLADSNKKTSLSLVVLDEAQVQADPPSAPVPAYSASATAFSVLSPASLPTNRRKDSCATVMLLGATFDACVYAVCCSIAGVSAAAHLAVLCLRGSAEAIRTANELSEAGNRADSSSGGSVSMAEDILCELTRFRAALEGTFGCNRALLHGVVMSELQAVLDLIPAPPNEDSLLTGEEGEGKDLDVLLKLPLRSDRPTEAYRMQMAWSEPAAGAGTKRKLDEVSALEASSWSRPLKPRSSVSAKIPTEKEYTEISENVEEEEGGEGNEGGNVELGVRNADEPDVPKSGDAGDACDGYASVASDGTLVDDSQ